MNLLLGEMFKREGVLVHFSVVDNDDTIASFAYHDGAAILSGDSDFYRYGHPFEMYKDFEYCKKTI